MKILVNVTNLKKGGGIQVAENILGQLRYFPKYEFHIFFSKLLFNQFGYKLKEKNMKIHVFDHPSRFIFFDNTKRKMSLAERAIKPDFVLSPLGPTYWIPKSLHIMGFANAIILDKEKFFLSTYNIFEKVFFYIKKFYHLFLLKFNADYYFFQTDDMKKKFSNLTKIDQNKLFTIVPSINLIFQNTKITKKKFSFEGMNTFKLLVLSAYYSHKNLEIINDVAEIIKKNKRQYTFIMTLDHKIYEKIFKNNTDIVLNIGPIAIQDCPNLYSKVDSLFLPSLIESFSANYPEAMFMKKPILTSNLSFAKDVCGDSALYFNPFEPDDIFQKIDLLATNKETYRKIIKSHAKNVKPFCSKSSTFKEILKIYNNSI